MGFFRTLFNVFSGPAFFLNLLDCRFRKAVLHLVLLSLLLSLALTLGHSWIYSSRIRTVCGNLYEQIGSLRFTRAEGVRTLNRPQEKQSYLLTDQLRFDYYPGKTLTAADVQKWNTPAGVLCMDRGLVVWVENYADSGKGRFMVFPLPADMADRSGQGRSFFSVNSRQELYDFLSSRFVLEPGAKLKLTEYEMTADITTGTLLLLLRLFIFFTALFSLSMMVIGAVLFFQCDAVFLERDVGTETDVQTDRGSADLHLVSRHGCNCVVFLFLGADDFTADGVFSGILSVLSGGVPAGSAGVESAAGTGTG